MNISKLNAFIIKTKVVNVEAYSNKDTEKHGFIISRMEGINYRVVISSEPVYDTLIKAKEEGDGLVKKIKRMSLSSIFD